MNLKAISLTILGVLVGAGGLRLYDLTYEHFFNDPINYLCKRGVTYVQVDPTSTVYVKSDDYPKCALKED